MFCGGKRVSSFNFLFAVLALHNFYDAGVLYQRKIKFSLNNHKINIKKLLKKPHPVKSGVLNSSFALL